MDIRISLCDDASLPVAAAVHSVSWQAAHRVHCTPDFVALHTPAHQLEYLRGQSAEGALHFLLTVDGRAVGLVTLLGSLIENLYILPEEQNRGYGTRLLLHAAALCPGEPTLWVLEGSRAERLYERHGFRFTGKRNQLNPTLAEREMARAVDR